MRDLFRRFFIPHKENDFKPHALQQVAAAVMLLLIMLSFSLANMQVMFTLGSEWFVSAILPAVLIDLTNEERGADNVTFLTRSTLLDTAAELKAKDMATYGYFAHDGPDGKTPWYWFGEVGYNYAYAGENLAVHFTDSDEVVKAWMNSPGHRKNILNGNYTEIGIGTAKGEYKGAPTVFVVQLFGTQLPAQNAVVQRSGTVSVPAEAPQETTQALVAASATTSNVAASTKQSSGTILNNETTEPMENDEALGEQEKEGVPQSDTVVFSDLATTSSIVGSFGEFNSPPQEFSGSTESQANGVMRAIARPSLWLSILYLALAAFVVMALVLSIVIEWRRQQPLQIAYGVGMLAVMYLLFHFHTILTGGALII